MKITWSADSTICAGAGGNGSVVYAYIVDRSLSWSNWEIQLTEDNKYDINLLMSVNNGTGFM